MCKRVRPGWSCSTDEAQTLVFSRSLSGTGGGVNQTRRHFHQFFFFFFLQVKLRPRFLVNDSGELSDQRPTPPPSRPLAAAERRGLAASAGGRKDCGEWRQRVCREASLGGSEVESRWSWFD